MENKQKSAINQTIEYYEKNVSAFIESTIDADVSELYRPFEKLLTPGCRILDLGCGSGRDSKYFADKGYDVVAVDPSPAMCAQTRSLVDIPVLEMKAEDIPFSNEFDAVWACASLLHVSKDNQSKTLRSIGEALKTGGICYCSWKYGEEERIVGGRHFTDFTEKTFEELLEEAAIFTEESIWTTYDVRSHRRGQKWLNVLVRKNLARCDFAKPPLVKI